MFVGVGNLIACDRGCGRLAKIIALRLAEGLQCHALGSHQRLGSTRCMRKRSSPLERVADGGGRSGRAECPKNCLCGFHSPRSYQASSSVRGLEVLFDSRPQELIETPMACCTVKPTRAVGSPVATTCMPVLSLPAPLPIVRIGKSSMV